jgi:hypothetical protein
LIAITEACSALLRNETVASHIECEHHRDKDGVMLSRIIALIFGVVAVAVLSALIRGSAIPYYVYVFGIEKKRPKLLWAVATGDRAEGGLRKVYSENGELVIELYGNGARVNGDVFAGDGNGACCPLSVTRTRYRWKKNRFVQHGTSEIFAAGGGGASLEMEYRKHS